MAGLAPKATVDPAVNPVPVRVTVVPPVRGPSWGATAVMAGRTRFVRSATVRLRMGGAAAASTARDVIQVLTWE